MITFSIITVSYNSDLTIERTLKSVLAQKVKDYEYIIVDGASKDSTMEIVKRYEPLFEGRMRWISEPDKGIYNAMNKGIAMAKGDIIGIVNSDDWWEEDTLSILSKYIESKGLDVKSEFVLTGWMTFHYNDGNKQVISRTSEQFVRGMAVCDMYLNHPATFVSSAAYRKAGVFDENLRIMADNELMLRLFKHSIDFHFLNSVLTNMSDGGASNVFNKKRLHDRYYIINKHEVKPLRKLKLKLRFTAKEILKWILPTSLIKRNRNRTSKKSLIMNIEQVVNYQLNKYPP